MTRKVVYAGALVAFLAAFATTIASIMIPRWISWDQPRADGSRLHFTYGLHSQCSNGACTPFPSDDFCLRDRSFCSMWRTVGFLMSLAIVLEGMTLVAFVVMLMGGVQKRVLGKTVIPAFLVLVAAVQAAGMGVVSYLYDNDARFFPGWKLDESFGLCTASWVICVVAAGGFLLVAGALGMEGDYELIPERDGEGRED